MRRRALAVATAGILAMFGTLHVEAASNRVASEGQSTYDTAKPKWCKKKMNKKKKACKKKKTGGLGVGSNCHSSYPDFCILPPPPDLDCAEVNGSNFTVVGSDPHGFDGDGDGRGCES